MFKLFALALTASLLGASATTAQAGCGRSCCAQPAPCCASAAAADEHANMNMSQAPQSVRSFSYQPGTGYGATRSMGSQGWNSGTRGAASKILGNY